MTDRKQQILAHCLALAKLDEAYAIKAAGWYEKNESWLLTGLKAKVEQVIRRQKAMQETPP